MPRCVPVPALPTRVVLLLRAAGLIALLCAAASARGDDAPRSDGNASTHWFSIGGLAGSTRPDQALADYQWDTRPQLAWGAQALAGRGRWAGGLRFWRTGTSQSFDLPDGPVAADVRTTSVEVVGRYRVATAWGVGVAASATAGRLHLGYDPDRITVQPSGSGPVTVELRPIDEWVAGGGVALVRPVASKWTVGLEVDTQFFALDTAHRDGGAIEYGRDSFGALSARIELARCTHTQ